MATSLKARLAQVEERTLTLTLTLTHTLPTPTHNHLSTHTIRGEGGWGRHRTNQWGETHDKGGDGRLWTALLFELWNGGNFDLPLPPSPHTHQRAPSSGPIHDPAAHQMKDVKGPPRERPRGRPATDRLVGGNIQLRPVRGH